MVEVATQSGTPQGLRDRVIVCVGYGGAMRADDLSRARLQDIEATPWGCVLRLRTSKDDPSGQAAETVVLLRRDDSLDPAGALADLAAAVGAATGPLVPVDVGSYRAMSPEGIADRVRSLAKRAGLRVAPTGHSLRRSRANHAYEAGIDLVTIQRHLRHSSPTITKGYIASLSVWFDNPAATFAARLVPLADIPLVARKQNPRDLTRPRRDHCSVWEAIVWDGRAPTGSTIREDGAGSARDHHAWTRRPGRPGRLRCRWGRRTRRPPC